MFCIKLEIHFLLCVILSMPHLEHGESLLTEYVCLAHIDLLHQLGGKLVQFLVEKFLFALFETAILATMLLQKIFEHVLREQPHNLSEVFRHMYLADVAYHICQALFGNICLHFWNECLQSLAVGNRFSKKLVAFLHTLLLGKTLVLALDEHPASIPQGCCLRWLGSQAIQQSCFEKHWGI